RLLPDYDSMSRADRAGGLLQFTVRYRGRIVGHCRMYLGRSSHSDNLIASEDTLYVDPAHRGAWLGMKLLRYVEQCLLQHAGDLIEIEANSKLANRADVLMRRMGYAPVATQFHKIVRRAPAQE